MNRRNFLKALGAMAAGVLMPKTQQDQSNIDLEQELVKAQAQAELHRRQAELWEAKAEKWVKIAQALMVDIDYWKQRSDYWEKVYEEACAALKDTLEELKAYQEPLDASDWAPIPPAGDVWYVGDDMADVDPEHTCATIAEALERSVEPSTIIVRMEPGMIARDPDGTTWTCAGWNQGRVVWDMDSDQVIRLEPPNQDPIDANFEMMAEALRQEMERSVRLDDIGEQDESL